MKNKIEIEYHQKKSKNKQDSFWYDGDVATLKYKDRQVTVVACGEIRIHNKDGELVFDCKVRNSGFPEFKNFNLRNDKDLAKLEKLGYIWENNNWFEVWYVYEKKNNVVYEDNIMGDVAYTYNQAIALAKDFLKDDDFWNRLDDEKNDIGRTYSLEDR